MLPLHHGGMLYLLCQLLHINFQLIRNLIHVSLLAKRKLTLNSAQNLKSTKEQEKKTYPISAKSLLNNLKVIPPPYNNY